MIHKCLKRKYDNHVLIFQVRFSNYNDMFATQKSVDEGLGMI